MVNEEGRWREGRRWTNSHISVLEVKSSEVQPPLRPSHPSTPPLTTTLELSASFVLHSRNFFLINQIFLEIYFSHCFTGWRLFYLRLYIAVIYSHTPAHWLTPHTPLHDSSSCIRCPAHVMFLWQMNIGRITWVRSSCLMVTINLRRMPRPPPPHPVSHPVAVVGHLSLGECHGVLQWRRYAMVCNHPSKNGAAVQRTMADRHHPTPLPSLLKKNEKTRQTRKEKRIFKCLKITKLKAMQKATKIIAAKVIKIMENKNLTKRTIKKG